MGGCVCNYGELGSELKQDVGPPAGIHRELQGCVAWKTLISVVRSVVSRERGFFFFSQAAGERSQPGGSAVMNPPARRRLGFDPWVRKIPWRRKWQPTPVFLPGESHGQRSLEGYRPWGRKRVGHDLVTEQQQGGEGGQWSRLDLGLVWLW